MGWQTSFCCATIESVSPYNFHSNKTHSPSKMEGQTCVKVSCSHHASAVEGTCFKSLLIHRAVKVWCVFCMHMCLISPVIIGWQKNMGRMYNVLKLCVHTRLICHQSGYLKDTGCNFTTIEGSAVHRANIIGNSKNKLKLTWGKTDNSFNFPKK